MKVLQYRETELQSYTGIEVYYMVSEANYDKLIPLCKIASDLYPPSSFSFKRRRTKQLEWY